MILLMFLLANAADPLRIFHRIAWPMMSFEDEAKFLLISKRYRKLVQRIPLNDDTTIFKFENQLKFPTKISLRPKVQEFLEKNIYQNSDRLENVEFAHDEQLDQWNTWGAVVMLDKQTNGLIGLQTAHYWNDLFYFTIFPDNIFQHFPYLKGFDNILLMLIKNYFPIHLEMFPVDLEYLKNWAFEKSFHKTFLYLTREMDPNHQLQNGVSLFEYAAEAGSVKALSHYIQNKTPDLNSLSANDSRNILWRAGAHVGVLKRLMEKLDKEKPNDMAGLQFDSEFVEFIAENFVQPLNRLRYLYEMPVYDCIRGMNNAFDTREIIEEKISKWEADRHLQKMEDMKERTIKRTANCVVVGIFLIISIAKILDCFFLGETQFDVIYFFLTSLHKISTVLQLQ